MVGTAQMKFASEARPSQYIVRLGNTEPTCMPLSGHFIDIEGRGFYFSMSLAPVRKSHIAD